MQEKTKSLVCQALMTCRALEEGTVLFRQNVQPVGRIVEVFGQVEHPFYNLRWPQSMTDPLLQIGEWIYVNTITAKYVLPSQLDCMGTDASNVFDEEPMESERTFVECTEDVHGDEVSKKLLFTSL